MFRIAAGYQGPGTHLPPREPQTLPGLLACSAWPPEAGVCPGLEDAQQVPGSPPPPWPTALPAITPGSRTAAPLPLIPPGQDLSSSWATSRGHTHCPAHCTAPGRPSPLAPPPQARTFLWHRTHLPSRCRAAPLPPPTGKDADLQPNRNPRVTPLVGYCQSPHLLPGVFSAEGVRCLMFHQQ